ncbi:conserved hypothetical protein [Histoplasma capsulatum var. duboisii H88]|uniref:Uncharacterized protein n=2 Tax=Ajellomyces capsulatus TaxID=5037 RepID=F0U6T8_AJEC8|nr:conserved hypothetical protein [Histoplasma capsulatum H143]EGC41517.1 conserved hypothetical protein [Histoplasma capsulatum var. duboisii H88]
MPLDEKVTPGAAVLHSWDPRDSVDDTPSDLKRVVEQRYLSRMPKMVIPLAIMKYFTVERMAKNETTGPGLYFKYWGLDITYPRITSCQPVLSDVIGVEKTIVCGNGQGCKVSRSVTLVDTYTNSVGWKIGGSVGADIGAGEGFTIKVSGTYERNYQETWARADGTTTTYEFTLKENTSCTPSMVHVDLLCDIEEATYKFDARFKSDKSEGDILVLENDLNKADRLQHCTVLDLIADGVKDDPENGMVWAPLWPKDHDRGFLFMGSVVTLNKYRLLSDDHEIRSNEIVIKSNPRKGNPFPNRVFICPPDQPLRKTGEARVPLKQLGNELLGAIGCV